MERVVLLTESGHRRGVLDKHAVHHHDTPLHLAFSCYLFDESGRMLLTKRASTKKTWPGAWTNSCCGHPEPGEDLGDAVRRRLSDELRVRPEHVTLVLPEFRYRAAMASGVVENEMCPVVWAETADPPRPEPSEVDEFQWVAWGSLTRSVLGGTREVSPWCAEQVALLAALGGRPREWPLGDPTKLPPAAVYQTS